MYRSLFLLSLAFCFTACHSAQSTPKSAQQVLAQRSSPPPTPTGLPLPQSQGQQPTGDDSGQKRSRSTGKYDPVYGDVAEASGGQVNNLDKSEVGHAAALMESSFAKQLILAFDARMDGTTREFEMPVDSYCQQIYLTSFTDNGPPRIDVYGPNGGELEEGTSAKTTRFMHGILIAIQKPTPGLWRLRLQASGRTSLRLNAKSDLFLVDFRFVKLGGRPAHEGMFRIEGQPGKGERFDAEATTSGNNVRSLQIKLYDNGWRELAAASFSSQSSNDDFHGALLVPNTPFRAVATGEDSQGRRYQRVYGPMFWPQ